MDDWEFYRYANGRWTWRNVQGANARESQAAFETWIEAVANAIAAGFEAGHSRLRSPAKHSRRSHPRARPTT
jgi:hypothetical protein